VRVCVGSYPGVEETPRVVVGFAVDDLHEGELFEEAEAYDGPPIAGTAAAHLSSGPSSVPMAAPGMPGAIWSPRSSRICVR